MRVQLSADVFDALEVDAAAAQNTLGLVEIFHHAYEGRHRVQLDDVSAFERWRARRDHGVATACDLAIERSDEAEVRGPAVRAIRVVAEPARWDTRPPALPLGAALRVLREKFKLVVEDRENDLGFLLAVMPPSERAELKAREGWWEVVHGGGLSPMLRTLRGLADDPAAGLHHFVVFDSDARLPATRSAEADLLASALGDIIEFHCLSRRAIENYATRQALARWAQGRIGDAGANDRVDAFFRMPTPSCRHHFNMKRGLDGDAKSVEGVAPGIFDALSTHERTMLGQGFGGLRKVLVEPGAIRIDDLVADGSFEELNRLVLRISSVMR